MLLNSSILRFPFYLALSLEQWTWTECIFCRANSICVREGNKFRGFIHQICSGKSELNPLGQIKFLTQQYSVICWCVLKLRNQCYRSYVTVQYSCNSNKQSHRNLWKLPKNESFGSSGNPQKSTASGTSCTKTPKRAFFGWLEIGNHERLRL